MRISTWNVNSIRTRVDRVVAFLQGSDVDVLAMQEIKCSEAQFPLAPFVAAGYEVAVHGVNQWNGVAIASRVGLTAVQRDFPGQPTFRDVIEPRAIGATAGGIRVWSVYVPNGRSQQDPHFQYKLQWLRALAAQAATWGAGEAMIMGDFNVALTDEDVWDIDAFADATHVSVSERQAVGLLAEHGFEELSRRFLPAPHTYTYWDYQQLRFPRNEGMRIDYAFGSRSLSGWVREVTIERAQRKGKQPSDHVPVVVSLERASTDTSR